MQASLRMKHMKRATESKRFIVVGVFVFVSVLVTLSSTTSLPKDKKNAVSDSTFYVVKNVGSEMMTANASTEVKIENNPIIAKKCELEGSFEPPSAEIIIDYKKIRGMDKSPLKRVTHLTNEKYVKHMLNEAGKEHYSFMNYMSATYGDCRHFMDIGTRYAASALAVGSNLRSPVWTFDRANSIERAVAFRGKTEEEWKAQVRSAGVDLKFHNLDLLKVSDKKLKKYLGTWFVFLDTFHKPDTVPFEREFFQRIIDIGFKGILGLDDIYLNEEMKKWWKEVQDGAEKGGYKTYDITDVGHFSGTGLVDFSGKVRIKKTLSADQPDEEGDKEDDDDDN